MNRKASFASVASTLFKLSDEELLAIAENPNLLKKFARGLVTDSAAKIFVIPYSDDEAVEWLFINNVYDDAGARALVTKWRKIASDLGYTGPVAWSVKEGFTLKQHAPLAGPCYDKLNYLQNWELRNDEPTKRSFNFWIPRLAEGSTGKSITQMETLRNELRIRYELPEHHCTSFGSAALLFALILAHFKRTGERVPLKFLYAASDTFFADGYRLLAGFFCERGLFCDAWLGLAHGSVGFFLLGVEFGNLGT